MHSAKSRTQGVERKSFSLCAIRIFTPTLTLPRRGGGDFEVFGKMVFYFLWSRLHEDDSLGRF
jgi:hypothetical protein